MIATKTPERESAAEPSSERSSQTANYYPYFDWLRLALALVVLFSHEGLIKGWPQAGNFAVQVFFALSGWLIGGVLLTLPKNQLRRFYFNRALRIWCPYFLALGLLVGVSLFHDSISGKWAEFVFYKTTFVYNLFGTRQLAQHVHETPLQGTGNHFWSVNAEEQFYLLAPLLLVLAPARYGRRTLTWAALALAAWLTAIYASIVFGVLAAVIANRHGAYYEHTRWRIAGGSMAVVSAVALGAGLKYDLVAPICAVSLVLLLAIKGKRNPWGELAGGMSYPLYLNSWVAVFLVNAVFKRAGLANPFVHATLTTASSLALAGFLYWYVDRRILSRRNRMYTPQRAWIAITFAYGAVACGLFVGLILYRFQ
jgi:peptidoglycan/LPS O-acetylase OafA/YrhL